MPADAAERLNRRGRVKRGGDDGAAAAASDEVLAMRAGGGDAAAFGALVERYAARGLSVAWRMIRRRSDAEDALQEAFLRLWTAAPRFDAERGARLSTWFHRILVNVCIDRGRRQRHHLVALDEAAEVADPAADAVERLAADETRRAVAAALAALPERQRAAVVLCYYEGLDNAAAAAALEVSVHALEALLVRGRRGLRRLLADHVAEPGETS